MTTTPPARTATITGHRAYEYQCTPAVQQALTLKFAEAGINRPTNPQIITALLAVLDEQLARTTRPEERAIDPGTLVAHVQEAANRNGWGNYGNQFLQELGVTNGRGMRISTTPVPVARYRATALAFIRRYGHRAEITESARGLGVDLNRADGVVQPVPNNAVRATDLVDLTVRGRQIYGWCDTAWRFCSSLGITGPYDGTLRNGHREYVPVPEIRLMAERFNRDYSVGPAIHSLLLSLGVDTYSSADTLVTPVPLTGIPVRY